MGGSPISKLRTHCTAQWKTTPKTNSPPKKGGYYVHGYTVTLGREQKKKTAGMTWRVTLLRRPLQPCLEKTFS